ncbi:uncharacterized protein LOC109194561 [Oreochromis niloticus]|uniref:uncharacterized protein LOC109194561 n=1 Tax=Oreochromis niloticus TaxID=8128 RepID=UPI0006745726|nr:lymphocyte antigen 6 complex locus protein G6d [Oreochromis niloticus]CAI5691122.1 unnamed protein product [Mustela putorius furo]
MKNLQWICAALMALFVTGESLTCNTCTPGFGLKCWFISTETCNNTQFSCYMGTVDFNISKWMTLNNQGCVSSALCNQTEKGSLLGITYTIKRNCCTTDQCNGASSAHLPLAAALGAAVAAVWSPWAF